MRAAEHDPVPVMFEPLVMPRVWGGRALGERFGKPLPEGTACGESWELVSLPGAESRVRGGPVAGATLSELIASWGGGLLGGAPRVEGRFPLLIKLLDAREALSVQVHPRPHSIDTADPWVGLAGGVKHEAWYVIDAEPGAELLIGLRPGVTRADVERAADGAALAACLRRWPARAGQCYYLPSGVPHALGGGILVAEVQTPSDTTYRLYDWDRVGSDGRPRALHRDQALAHLRDDVAESEITQPRAHIADAFATVTTLVRSPCFLIDRVRLIAGTVRGLPHAEMTIWIVLTGGLVLRWPSGPRRSAGELLLRPGDVVLLPAESGDVRFSTESGCDLLEVRIPLPSSLAGLPRPERDAPASPPGPTRLTIGGRDVSTP